MILASTYEDGSHQYIVQFARQIDCDSKSARLMMARVGLNVPPAKIWQTEKQSFSRPEHELPMVQSHPLKLLEQVHDAWMKMQCDLNPD